MIVIVLLGIGICLLVLMEGKGDKRPAQKETPDMTSQQIADMIRDNEKTRRRERFERGTGYGQYGTRIDHRRSSDVRGNKGNQRATYGREY
jgi:hypothetical protein